MNIGHDNKLIAMRQITIIGLGLIGGSIGLALKQPSGEKVEVVGYARNQEKANKALQRGAVDRIEYDLAAAVKGAELVILSTPVLAIREILRQIREHLPAGCVVTDTASTKEEVMKWSEEYLPLGVNFVGGHPMAGKELSGIEAADPDLFQGCTYCLIPGHNSSPELVQCVVGLVSQLGAKPLFITAVEHDTFVGGISHLPLILSSALVAATSRDVLWREMSGLAATGYRDTTRLASQDPRMNRDICLTNRSHLINWIDDFSRELNHFRQLIVEGSAELEQAFLEVQQERQRWLEEYDKKD